MENYFMKLKLLCYLSSNTSFGSTTRTLLRLMSPFSQASQYIDTVKKFDEGMILAKNGLLVSKLSDNTKTMILLHLKLNNIAGQQVLEAAKDELKDKIISKVVPTDNVSNILNKMI
jgi:hypothetical protein